MMTVLRVLLALFLSGSIFLFTIYRLFGLRFRWTFKKLISSIVLSVGISTAVSGVHHGYMGLSTHLWFDNLSMIVLAVLMACLAVGVLLPLPQRVVRRLLLGKKNIRPTSNRRRVARPVPCSRPAVQPVVCRSREPFDYAGCSAAGF